MQINNQIGDPLSKTSGVILDFVQNCGQFGKFSAMLMSRKWSGLKSALCTLSSSTAAVSLFQASSFGLEMLTVATDQMRVANPTTVTDLIACACMATTAIFSPWYQPSAEEGCGVDAVNALGAGDDDDRELDRRRQLVRDFLRVAWEAILGEEDLGLVSLQEFIHLISHPVLSRTMDADTILVSIVYFLPVPSLIDMDGCYLLYGYFGYCEFLKKLVDDILYVCVSS